MLTKKELEMGSHLHSVYVGILYFDRFFGIKAGRSVWKQSFVKTREYSTYTEAREALFYIIDYIAPAMGVKTRSCIVETALSSNIPF